MLNSGLREALRHGLLSEATMIQCFEASNLAIVVLLTAEKDTNDRMCYFVDGDL